MQAEVVFDLQGQRCHTSFDSGSDLSPLEWIEDCVKRGILFPVELRINGRLIYKEADLEEMVKKWLGNI